MFRKLSNQLLFTTRYVKTNFPNMFSEIPSNRKIKQFRTYSKYLDSSIHRNEEIRNFQKIHSGIVTREFNTFFNSTKRTYSSNFNDENDDDDGKNEKEEKQKSFVVGFFTFSTICLAAVLAYKMKEFNKFYQQQKEKEELEKIKKMNTQDLDVILKAIENDISEDGILEETGYIAYSKFFKFLSVTFRVIHLFLKFFPIVLMYPVCIKYNNEMFPKLKEFWYNWLLSVVKSSGPLAVKLGQWVSTRPDLFSHEVCLKFEVLHDSGIPHQMSHTKKAIKNEFKHDIDEIFEEFNEVPIGVGAIAQVYRAKLRPAYRLTERVIKNPYVAVKVLHPNIRSYLVRDLRILQTVCSFANLKSTWNWLELDKNVIFFSKYLQEQVDLRNEAKNLIQFNFNFREFKGIIFPHPVKNLVSKTVLVETFEDGIPIKEFVHRKDDVNMAVRKRIASLGVLIVLKMLVADNFFHSDMHPGNMYVKLDYDEKKGAIVPGIIVLDAGLKVELPRSILNLYYEMLKSLTKRDGTMCAMMLLKNTKKYGKFVNPETNLINIEDIEDPIEKEDVQNFVDMVCSIVTEIADRQVGDVRVSEYFQKGIDCANNYKVSLDPSFMNVTIGLIIAEGLARQLHNEVEFLAVCKKLMKVSSSSRREFFYQCVKGITTKGVDSQKMEEYQKLKKTENI